MKSPTYVARGFSLVEFLVSTAAGLVLLGASMLVFRSALDLGDTELHKAELLQNARVAINMISRDVASAGTGLPNAGVQLPSGSGAASAVFACDYTTTCYVSANTYPAARLYALNPGDGLGPWIEGVATDVLTIAYKDPSSALDQYPLAGISAQGDQIEFSSLTSPGIDDPASGIVNGDVLVVCNVNGCAAGTVTAVNGATNYVSFETGDCLHFNQPSAGVGNIQSLATPPGSGVYPQTSAFRVLSITYYIDAATQPVRPWLMRQVNGQPPVPVAENIGNLQLSYDTFDENTSVATVNLANAGGVPNQIRKVNISVTGRVLSRHGGRSVYDRITLATSVCPRNLSFKDEYR